MITVTVILISIVTIKTMKIAIIAIVITKIPIIKCCNESNITEKSYINKQK